MTSKKHSYKPKRIILGYNTKKQLHSGFKVIEYSRMSNEDYVRRKTIAKNLTVDGAEEMIYELEKKLK